MLYRTQISYCIYLSAKVGSPRDLRRASYSSSDLRPVGLNRGLSRSLSPANLSMRKGLREGTTLLLADRSTLLPDVEFAAEQNRFKIVKFLEGCMTGPEVTRGAKLGSFNISSRTFRSPGIV